MSMVPHYYGGHRGGIFDPFSMDMWDPFKNFHRHAMSTMPPHSSEISRDTSSFVNTCIDWRETQEAHIFKADLPGLKKEEVKVELADDKLLQISGERCREVEQSSDMWHRVERFRLPDNVKMDQIRASVENRVLTVTVPKEEAKKRDIRAIAISG